MAMNLSRGVAKMTRPEMPFRNGTTIRRDKNGQMSAARRLK
jgi:hypothetical protein